MCSWTNGLFVLFQGLRVWLKHKGQWLPSHVTGATAADVSFASAYGDVRKEREGGEKERERRREREREREGG